MHLLIDLSKNFMSLLNFNRGIDLTIRSHRELQSPKNRRWYRKLLKIHILRVMMLLFQMRHTKELFIQTLFLVQFKRFFKRDQNSDLLLCRLHLIRSFFFNSFLDKMMLKYRRSKSKGELTKSIEYTDPLKIMTNMSRNYINLYKTKFFFIIIRRTHNLEDIFLFFCHKFLTLKNSKRI